MQEDLRVTLQDGRTIAYAQYGDADGKPILFCHGWPSSRLQARALEEPAKEQGICVLAPDRAGIGDSSAPPQYTFSRWANDVEEWLDALGVDTIRIYGVSGGAPYALSASLALGDRVAKTAIVCGAPPLDSEARKNMHIAYRVLGSSEKLRRAMFPIFIPVARWIVHRGAEKAPMSWMLKSLPDSDRNALTKTVGWDMITRSFLEAVKHGGRDILNEGELYLRDWDFDPSELQQAVRFWHGKEDANLPIAAAEKVASRIPHAETKWIDEQGHYSIALETRQEVLHWLFE